MGRIEPESFIKIEGWMTDLGISGSDIILYALIHGFSIKKNGEKLYPAFFWGSLNTMMKWTSNSRQTVLDSLSRLQGIDPEIKKKRSQKRKKQVIYTRLIMKEIVPQGKNHYSMYYTLASREIIKGFYKKQSENQTSQNDSGLIIRPLISENQTSDNLNFRHNNSINTDNNTSTSEEADLLNNRIIEAVKSVFFGQFPFDDSFSGKVLQVLVTYKIPENEIKNYIHFVYNRVIMKNPDSISNYFYSIVSKSSLVSDFKIQLEKQNNTEVQNQISNVTCPVCGCVHLYNETCPSCKLRCSSNKEEIEIKRKIFELPKEIRCQFEKELSDTTSLFDIKDFVGCLKAKTSICKKYLPSIPDELIHYCF